MFGFDRSGMGVGALGIILIWAVPVTVGVWLLLRGRYRNRRSGSRKPLTILDERYVHSDIGQGEYNARRAMLNWLQIQWSAIQAWMRANQEAHAKTRSRGCCSSAPPGAGLHQDGTRNRHEP